MHALTKNMIVDREDLPREQNLCQQLASGSPQIDGHDIKRFASLLLYIVVAPMLGGCLPSDHLSSEQRAIPLFDPVIFFAGHTEGRGALTVILQDSEPTLVDGRGVITANGTIVLDQTVTRGNGSPTHRTRHLHRDGPARYVGTLTDAVGPVLGEVSNNRFHLSFEMKRGLHAEQWLYLQPDGRIARNRMEVRKFGIVVASLDETITRLQP